MSTYNIIADNITIVNGDIANAVSAVASERKFKKLSVLKSRSIVIAEKLSEIGEAKRGVLMKACNTTVVLKKCPKCGKTHIETLNLCRDRLCPVCGYLLSVKRYNQMQRTMKEIDISKYQWRFLTLTIKNCRPAQLSETISKMLKAWDRVCKRVILKKNLVGWARSLEITYNNEAGTFHPHIHILCAFECVPHILEICEAWREVLDLDYDPICDIEEPYSTKAGEPLDNAIIEAFKYCCKSKQVADMPLLAFRTLVDSLKNRRLIAFGGIIKAARAAANIIENDEAETVIEKNCCGQELGELVYRWSFDDKVYKRD